MELKDRGGDGIYTQKTQKLCGKTKKRAERWGSEKSGDKSSAYEVKTFLPFI